jgi:hypothetical protein
MNICSLLVSTVDSDVGTGAGMERGTVRPGLDSTFSSQPYAGPRLPIGGAGPSQYMGLNADTNMCKPDKESVWCLPPDYNQEKHPFTCEYPSSKQCNVMYLPSVSNAQMHLQ